MLEGLAEEEAQVSGWVKKRGGGAGCIQLPASTSSAIGVACRMDAHTCAGLNPALRCPAAPQEQQEAQPGPEQLLQLAHAERLQLAAANEALQRRLRVALDVRNRGRQHGAKDFSRLDGADARFRCAAAAGHCAAAGLAGASASAAPALAPSQPACSWPAPPLLSPVRFCSPAHCSPGRSMLQQWAALQEELARLQGHYLAVALDMRANYEGRAARAGQVRAGRRHAPLAQSLHAAGQQTHQMLAVAGHCHRLPATRTNGKPVHTPCLAF
jgi:hypothetical protein